jgi:hypothetical protein
MSVHLDVEASRHRRPLQHSREAGGCERCPSLRNVKKPPDRKQRRFLALEEIARIGQTMREAEASGKNPVAVAAIRLLVMTGLRRMEALATPRAGFSLISLRDCRAYSRMAANIPRVRDAAAAPPVATPPRPSFLRGLAVFPAMMSVFSRSISAVVRLRTVNLPISGLTCGDGQQRGRPPS